MGLPFRCASARDEEILMGRGERVSTSDEKPPLGTAANAAEREGRGGKGRNSNGGCSVGIIGIKSAARAIDVKVLNELLKTPESV